MLFLERSAEARYGLHYRNKKKGFATHNAGHLIRKVSQLEHFRIQQLGGRLVA